MHLRVFFRIFVLLNAKTMTQEEILSIKGNIEMLKGDMIPLYEKLKETTTSFNASLVESITSAIYPIHKIGVCFSDNNIEFFTIEESLKKGSVPYADFGSSVTLYNHYDFNVVDYEKAFNPELSSSSIRMEYKSDSKSYELTKIMMLNYLSIELHNHFTKPEGSLFIDELKAMFAEYRHIGTMINVLQSSVRTLENKITTSENNKKAEELNNNIKVGNWMKMSHNPFHKETKYSRRANYTIFVNITKVSDKTITVQVYREDNTRILFDEKRVNKEDISFMFKYAEFLEKSPIPVEENA